MQTLDLKYNVDVIVNVAPRAAYRRLFNCMLIVGTSTIIPASERIRKYYSTDEMLADGWSISNPEYVAAQLAFSSPKPPSIISIGRQDQTSGSIASITLGSGGTGYSANDVLTIVQSGGANGTAKVLTVNGSGVILTLELLAAGTGYAVASGLATTVAPSGGSAATINVTSINETSLAAVQACRAADSDWYACQVCGIKNSYSDIEAIAAYIQTATPSSVFGFNTDQNTVPTNSTADILSVLKALKYRRTIMQYCSYAAQPNAIASILGFALGANTGLANSAYTLDFKSEPGLIVEPISTTQFNYITGKNGNVYVNRGNYYDWFQNGTMADGSWFDEVINLDKLANDIQLNVADLLNQTPKVPQTEAGMNQIKTVIAVACDQAVTIGFIAPGRWTGPQILNLDYGDTLPRGYLIQSAPIATQAQADRDARKAPPIYVAVKLAGAIQQVTIEVDVNR